jgi:aspartate aminotransferase/aminotransferase
MKTVPGSPNLKGTLPAMPFRRAVADSPQAMSIYFNQIVYDLRRRGQDVVALSLGEAFFDIPAMDFTKLDLVRGYHYSDSQGLPELRQKIAAYYCDHYGANVSGVDDLLISAGSKPLIYMAMLTVLEPGDEVLIHEPAWVSYPEQAKMAGAVPRFIRYDCPVSEFSAHFSPRTRMLVINNPNNPGGRLYTADELRDIYRQCRSRGIYIMVDEAYSDFVIGDEFHSMARIIGDKDGIIVVNSLSKNMGISGWRIGYVIAAPVFIAELLKVNQHIITCAPTILQQYCSRYFDDIIAVTLPQVTDVVKKRERVAAMMDELRIARMGGGTTFYFFVEIGDYPGTSIDFALSLLLDHNIAVVPGSAYGDSTDRFVRVSIGTESEERIWEALVILQRQIRANRHDSEGIAQKLKSLGIPPITGSPGAQ